MHQSLASQPNQDDIKDEKANQPVSFSIFDAYNLTLSEITQSEHTEDELINTLSCYFDYYWKHHQYDQLFTFVLSLCTVILNYSVMFYNIFSLQRNNNENYNMTRHIIASLKRDCWDIFYCVWSYHS